MSAFYSGNHQKNKKLIFKLNCLVCAFFSLLISACKPPSNATLKYCSKGGVIIDNNDYNIVDEILLGAPNHPITNSKIEVFFDGQKYTWSEAIALRGSIGDIGERSLGPHSFGFFPPRVKRYYFAGMNFFVMDNELYAIWVHASSSAWKQKDTIFVDGKNLRNLKVDEAKELFGRGVSFESISFLRGVG